MQNSIQTELAILFLQEQKYAEKIVPYLTAETSLKFLPLYIRSLAHSSQPTLKWLRKLIHLAMPIELSEERFMYTLSLLMELQKSLDQGELRVLISELLIDDPRNCPILHRI